MSTTHRRFETAIEQLTRPFNGQFPRPWMTDLTDPLSAQLFVVGMNQAKGYPVTRLTHERHLNALFNRAGESCRGLYYEMHKPSRARPNLDRLRLALSHEGVKRILETNVVCYSTAMSSDLRSNEHAGGREQGTVIFRTLLGFVRPKALIVHGSQAAKALGKCVDAFIPPPPSLPSEPVSTDVAGMKVFVIPSLAPPAWNTWCGGADEHLTKVARTAAASL